MKEEKLETTQPGVFWDASLEMERLHDPTGHSKKNIFRFAMVKKILHEPEISVKISVF